MILASFGSSPFLLLLKDPLMECQERRGGEGEGERERGEERGRGTSEF